MTNFLLVIHVDSLGVSDEQVEELRVDVGAGRGEGAALLPAEDLGLGGLHGLVGEGLVAVLHGEEVSEGAPEVGVSLADEAGLVALGHDSTDVIERKKILMQLPSVI